jgi:hypothetical protein
MAERGGEVDWPRPAQHADDQVAQAGHHAWTGTGADPAGVLGEGDVAKVVQRLDGPVPTQRSARRAGLATSKGRLVTA